MKKKIWTFFSYVLVAMLAALLTRYSMAGTAPAKLTQLMDLIDEKFIGEYDAVTAEDAAAYAMVDALGDRWSYYIPAAQYETHKEQAANAYVGIGITITPLEEGGMEVVAVNPDGPAFEAGILAGDVAVAVNGQSILEMDAEETRNLVRGKEGTELDVTVLRGGEELTLTVTRRRVQTRVASGQMLAGNVGLVTIENFDSRCAAESIAAMESLLADGAQMLIFDVRNNPGGYADELVKLLDYLLPEGELFRTVDYAGRENVDRSDAACLDVPMAVLVNADSYSAAEFFAAALSEYDAAVVVGQKTSGKGYFQNTFRLNDGSAVGLSVGKYFTPKGENLQDVGITPDVEISVDEETAMQIYLDALEPENDPQIQAALSALKSE